MICRPTPRIMVFAPNGTSGIRVAAAACRASGLGVLDPGTAPAASPRETLAQLARLTTSPFGIRLDSRNPDLDAWLDASIDPLSWIIVKGLDHSEGLRRVIGQARQLGRSVVGEATSQAEIATAFELGTDGVVVAGNEAGGNGGDESSYVLMQKALAMGQGPVWVRGGVGPLVAAGCLAAGAAGVVLDGAVLLAAESGLKARLGPEASRWDGGETISITPAREPGVRVWARPGSPALARLKSAAVVGGETWRTAVASEVGWNAGQCPPLGQDAAFAYRLATKHVTTGGIVQAFELAIEEGLAAARATRSLAEGSPMAQALGTRYPILQGPMTRVSDVATFALAVARGGGLPFLALAMLRGREVRPLLEETARLAGGRPWGVGILGFVPPELRAEQIEAVRALKPPYALIAGGRPDQAAELDRDGITTFLHVPSPGLLDQYLRDGCRRFVLEGRECGGHVGPRSSFVLWEQACVVAADAIDRGLEPGELSLVFAGGIHDARSAALVSALTAPLAARGVKIGVLVGTAYLFTAEAVDSGAIVRAYQEEALRCRETVLLESGPGHQVRVSPTPFAAQFALERTKLVESGKGSDVIKDELERLNVGRLRIATKGLARDPGVGSPLVAVDAEVQTALGLYMLGQVAALRSEVTTIAAVHEAISRESLSVIEQAAAHGVAAGAIPARPSDVAVIGMSAHFPGAIDVERFWSNTLRGVDSVTEVPLDRWDWRLYYDPDPKTPDKIISKWGGFLPDVPFDPLRHGMPPASLPSIEPAQLLALEVAREALDDAGYRERMMPRERTAVVLGMGGGAAQLAMGYAFRSYLPMLDAVAPGSFEACQGLLPEWTEDSFPGFLLNVTAGRIANRLNLGGANYTVDAACGSSLAAAALAVRELETGAADVVLLGGVDTVQNPFTYLAFSKTQAFSPSGRCRPFDSGANGIVISEGAAFVVLKRLADAERDGDRIYAVIKGVGASSDGRARGLTAPVVQGQARALDRAYAKAAVSPAQVGYVEAHGTGTALGDAVEIEALGNLFQNAGAEPGSCTLGSIKSMIGHTKCAAGLAGLLNASLALHHRVIPPTIGVKTPSAKLDLDQGPFRLRDQAAPWSHGDHEEPRRAGVSAFGFGGANFHAVLEEYRSNLTPPPTASMTDWPAELFVWRAETTAAIQDQITTLIAAIDAGARPRPVDLARALGKQAGASQGRAVLAVVAAEVGELRDRIKDARMAIARGETTLDDPRGIYLAAAPAFAGAKVAFVFPGQGAQSPGMSRELAVAFPMVREAFDQVDQTLRGMGRPPIGPVVFPPTAFSEPQRAAQAEALRATDVAQPALAAACVGMLKLMEGLGIEADILAGHSFGELVGLHAAGALDATGLYVLAAERGRLMAEAGREHPGAMAAITAPPEQVETLIAKVPEASIANHNGPRQTVVAGPTGAVARVVELAGEQALASRLLAVSGAFHTSHLAVAADLFAAQAAAFVTHAPARPVYSNLDARPHPDSTQEIAGRLGNHLQSPVQFAAMIKAMHDDGARVFVEVGPGGGITPLVSSILGDSPHLAVACDMARQQGLPVFLKALARLITAGVGVELELLTSGRARRSLDLNDLPTGEWSQATTASTWLVNGSRSRPILGPEPRRLGAVTPGAPAIARPRAAEGAFTSQASHTNGKVNPMNHPPISARDHAVGPRLSTNPSATPARSADRVMESFQETMRLFLETQKATMLSYLAAKGAGEPLEMVPSPGPRSELTRGFGRRGGSNGEPTPGSHANGEAHSRAEPEATPPSTEPEPTRGTGIPREEEISARLLEIVRDRTGYPLETLGLDLDIEADLGIDSIKRVEILGKLRDLFPDLKALSSSAEVMDSLARSRTLGAIVDRMSDLVKPAAKELPAVDAAKAIEPSSAPPRLLLEIIPAPLSGPSISLPAGGRLIATDDGRGVARELERLLEPMGIAVDVIGGPDRTVEWTSVEAVAKVVHEVRAHGPIVGLVHALPLATSEGADQGGFAWSRRVGPEVKGLFLLAKAIMDDLETAARNGGACLIAATALGGRLGSSGGVASPSHGGVAGLVKTLAREWPSVRARVVDFPLDHPHDRIARDLLEEMTNDDAWPEVGRGAGGRVRSRTVHRPLKTASSPLELAEGEPIVISGGARGITALLALELARFWRPKLLILGSTPLPQDDEPTEIAGLNDEVQIKSALNERIRRSGRPGRPAEIESLYQAVRCTREIKANLAAYRSICSVVDYAPVDVRNATALRPILASFRARHGEFAGLIHGAGLIQDKLIRDKTAESFDRVMETKLAGALNLIDLVDGGRLKFTALFSSIAGRYGNVGQSDYAAANEILSKLALWLDERVPGRVASLIWGPWSEVGMVSRIEGHLSRSGLGLIAPEAGRRLLLDELRHGRKGEVEVILAGGLGTLEQPIDRPAWKPPLEVVS